MWGACLSGDATSQQVRLRLRGRGRRDNRSAKAERLLPVKRHDRASEPAGHLDRRRRQLRGFRRTSDTPVCTDCSQHGRLRPAGRTDSGCRCRNGRPYTGGCRGRSPRARDRLLGGYGAAIVGTLCKRRQAAASCTLSIRRLACCLTVRRRHCCTPIRRSA